MRENGTRAAAGHRPVVWLVTELYWPEETSTGFVLTAVAEELARTYEVRVICGRPNYSARGTRAPARETRNGVRIRRCPGTRLDKDVVPFRVINALTLGTSIFFRELMEFRPGDVVMAVTTPPSLPPLAALAARLRRARFVLLVHDVYPDTAVAGGVVRPGSAAFRGMEAVLRRVYGTARAIVACGRDMRELIVRRLGGGEDAERKVVFIPNFAELDRVHPAPRMENPLLRELGLLDRFVVQVAGNLGRPHAVETLGEAARRLRAVPEVHFLVIGSGARMSRLRAIVDEEGLSNVTIIGSRPRAEQQTFLNACDVSLIPFVDGMWGLGVPSRSYNALAAGKPLLAAMDPDSEIGRLVEEAGVGWRAGVEDPGRLVECILEARDDPGRLAEMGRRAEALARSDYSLGRVAEQYRAVVERVARG
jgi:colanic acid biosynthesis glycosyl transferase WcaI